MIFFIDNFSGGPKNCNVFAVDKKRGLPNCKGSGETMPTL